MPADARTVGEGDRRDARRAGAARLALPALRHRRLPAPGLLRGCTSDDVEERRLARRGTLWTWTVQRFPPKSPPYAGAAEEFEPYGVGYVELPGEVRVEARLTESDPARLRIGMPMELTLIPAPVRTAR